MSRLPAHLDPFHLPRMRLARCPICGDGGLVGEHAGTHVTVLCTGIDCKFTELHGPDGFVDQAAEAKRLENIRLGKLKGKGKGKRAMVVKKAPTPTPEPKAPPQRRPANVPPPPCRIDGCDRASRVLGMCARHHARYLHCGYPDLQTWIDLGGPPPKTWKSLIASIPPSNKPSAA